MHCERYMLPNPVPLHVHLIGEEGGIPNRAAVSFSARLYQNNLRNQKGVRPSIDLLGTDWCLLSSDFGWQSSIRFLFWVVGVLHFLFYLFLFVCFEYLCPTVTAVGQSIKCRSIVCSYTCTESLMFPSGSDVPAVRRACPCCPVAL